jgi:hypothetical protein
MQHSTQTYASPPLRLPTHAFAKVTRTLDIFPLSIRVPERIKKGIAINVMEFKPEKTLGKAPTAVMVPSIPKTDSPAIVIEKPSGTAKNSKPKNITNTRRQRAMYYRTSSVFASFLTTKRLSMFFINATALNEKLIGKSAYIYPMGNERAVEYTLIFLDTSFIHGKIR